MNKKARVINWRTLAATFVFVFATIGAQLLAPLQVLAAGATTTWTGANGDGKFSTSGNWSNGVPTDGDSIVFTATDGSPHTLNNDLSGVAFAGVTYGGGSVGSATSFTINTLALKAGATITQSGYASSIEISGSVTAAGALTFVGTTSPFGASTAGKNVSFSNLTITNAPPLCAGGGAGEIMHWKPTGTVTVGTTSQYLPVGTEATVNAHANATVVFTGGASAVNLGIGGAMTTDDSCDNDYHLYITDDTTLSGTITLNGNVKYFILPNKTLTITGTINGPSYSMQAASGSSGNFVNNASSNNSETPSGSQEVPVTELPPVTDNQPNQSLVVASKTIVALDGTRGSVTVSDLGVLKGTGTADNLYVDALGTVAPGHSPGKLTVLTSLSLYGTYLAEVQNKDLYDQLDVGANHSGGGTAVTLNSDSKLTLNLYGGYVINQGETYTLINNRSNTAVSGTFKGLAEGAQFTVGNAVFSISYVGGDGNDVVVTALKTVVAPGTPNTGAMKLITSNPLVVAIAGISLAALAFAAIRKTARR